MSSDIRSISSKLSSTGLIISRSGVIVTRANSPTAVWSTPVGHMTFHTTQNVVLTAAAPSVETSSKENRKEPEVTLAGWLSHSVSKGPGDQRVSSTQHVTSGSLVALGSRSFVFA